VISTPTSSVNSARLLNLRGVFKTFDFSPTLLPTESAIFKLFAAITMPTEATKDQPLNDTPISTSSIPALPEPPYSIFDRRQKWLIVALVSTAATCEFTPASQR